MGIVLSNRLQSLQTISRIFIFCANLLALYGLIQFFDFDFLPAEIIFQKAGRIISTFENPNYFGNFLACILPIGIGLFLSCKTNKHLLYLMVCNALLYLGILVSGSRGAWWAALFGISLTIFGSTWQTQPKIPILKRSLFLSIIYTVITLSFSNQVIIKQTGHEDVAIGERLLSSRHILKPVETDQPGYSEYALSHRRWIWHNTLHLIQKRPVLGYGLGQFKTAFSTHHQQTEPNSSKYETVAFAHNEGLHIAAETGLPGLLGFLGLLASILIQIVRFLRNNSYPPHRWGLLGLVCAMLFDSQISYPLHLPLNGLIFWITLGLLLGQAQQKIKNAV